MEPFLEQVTVPRFQSSSIIQKRDQKETGTQTADILDLSLQCELMTSTPLHRFQCLSLNSGFTRAGYESLGSFLGS